MMKYIHYTNILEHYDGRNQKVRLNFIVIDDEAAKRGDHLNATPSWQILCNNPIINPEAFDSTGYVQVDRGQAIKILQRLDQKFDTQDQLDYQYFANLDDRDEAKMDNPYSIIRSTRSTSLESYCKALPVWMYDKHEMLKMCKGDQDHYPITRDDAMSIIERWKRERQAEGLDY